ncbi:uncharacterized protein [Nicotiana sylvestris]|uniref:uncharacterized protein n=1 Tax=Nicotiana sylvestris TaxID=4096 RepID=UPI00388C3835
MPSEGWVKVNTDGASRGNPGKSSIGVCVRNQEGDVIYALGKEINEATNTEAKALAFLEALKIGNEHNYNNVWLQTDSMPIKKFVEELWKTPWCIVKYMEEIWQLMGRGNYRVSHIYREGDKQAYYLANYAIDIGDIEFHGFWQLDSKGRKIVNQDKLQCPYLRVKVARN